MPSFHKLIKVSYSITKCVVITPQKTIYSTILYNQKFNSSLIYKKVNIQKYRDSYSILVASYKKFISILEDHISTIYSNSVSHILPTSFMMVVHCA